MSFFAKNIGFEDKIIRILLTVLFVLLGIKYSMWFFLLAALMFLEAIFSRCALYALLKIDTYKTAKASSKPKKKSKK